MKGQKGITLIALVITIIVMLILVTVTVTTVMNSGLFDHAGKAVNDYGNAQNIESDMDNQINVNGVKGINNIVEQYNVNKTSP